VLPEMASTCGVSKSNVSREATEAGEEALQELLERHFEDVDLLVIYIDGMMFGDHHVISAVGVDAQGHKHVLGIQQGATENAAAVEDLLQQLVGRGVKPDTKRLFVIDGARALRAAIHKVFGPQHPVQRCRNHKIRNVVERLPEEQKDQAKAVMRASYRLEAKEGMARRRKLADWLEQESPAAANSLREGLEECFTIKSPGRAAVAASLPGHDQSDRKPAVGGTDADAACLPLARCGHGRALGGSVLPGDGEKLPPHHGLERSLATGSDLGRDANQKAATQQKVA